MNGWANFSKYIGVQGVLALLITLAVIIWGFFNIPIPEQIWTLLGASWGFYFAKNGNQIVTSVRATKRKG